MQVAGVTKIEKQQPKGSTRKGSAAATAAATSAEENECDICRANLYVSWVRTDDDNNNLFCLQHCLKYINSDRLKASQCRLIVTYAMDDVELLIAKIRDKTAAAAAAVAMADGGASSHGGQPTTSSSHKGRKGANAKGGGGGRNSNKS